MKSVLSALLVSFFVFTTAFAQQSVSGVVSDAKGLGIPRVSVKVKGASSGTSTDAEGKFSIQVPNRNAVLQFSSVGFVEQEVSVGNQSSLAVTLIETAVKLDEVVVVGYGTQRRKDLTGSVSSISSDQLTLGGTTSNIAQAIQGRAAGVKVQQNDFSPGGGISIVIRGGNSINTTNEPLYVVDGFISDNGKFINPNDIDDIQVLKDASATAIYGARGGNGVILITTKKGRAGKMLIEGDASNGYQYLTYKPDLITGQQYAEVQNAIAGENGRPPLFPSSFPVTNTNWWNLTTQRASVLNRTVSLSANDKTSKLYLSGNYFKQTGVLKKTDMERYSARIGTEKSFNDRVKVGANFYGASTTSHLQRYVADITAPLFSILTGTPSIPAYNEDGSYYRYLGKDNPLASLLEPTNTATNRLINANIFADYGILKNLTYHISAGAEFNQSSAGQYTPRTLVNGQVNNGVGQIQTSTSLRWLVEQYLTYKYSRGAHALTALLGTSSQKDAIEGLNAGARGFSTDVFLFYNLFAGSIPTVAGGNVPSSSKIETKLASYYGRLNYTYNDRLLATFTLRDDASSRFGPNFRHGVFPSGAVAWRLTDEDFVKNMDVFSNLKLRVSYGIMGNDRIGDYAYLTRFTPYGTSLAGDATFSGGIEPASLANNNLKWESTAQTDIGLDMGFLAGRLNATLDFYHKKTTDLLLAVPVGQWWGFSAQTANAGSIENKGVELSLNSDLLRGRSLTWSAALNLAYNKQKTLELANNVTIISTNTANPSGVVSAREFTRLEPGKELGVVYGFKYAGVIKTGETYAPQPNAKAGDPKFEDLDGDGEITQNDRTYLGNTNPRYVAGLSNDFQYKNFDLSIFFQGAFGYYLYNMNRLVLESTTGADVLNRWVGGKNEDTNIPREGYFLSKYGSYVNSRFVENASYLRLKMVSLGYTVPVGKISALKFVEGLRVYASGQNLLTFTKYTGTDPEVNVHSGSNVGGGIDFNAFPAFRTFTFGVKLSIH